ncbi:FprA family A-type flavoprotein [Clostridium gasigenes]|uniref:FprA family A-type flavoprotein n=1 Tax=Clostridium gasigenes TaxID=94869 RepID=UPI0014382A96|nr:FprA family A-type flavoprotein [Clostridium gasigenes]NKF07655.1 FprA family A-type flavoprotein [Clostridium gasigenes]QSW18082.1 FprA family A-type flavoprotein [Clostridium gasigenes]
MFCVREVTEDLYWVGGNDKRLALFENIHPIPRGVSYNSYLLLDEKTVLFDTVDWSIGRQFLENIQHVLAGRTLDYLVINHMEPDHGASVEEILLRYPDVKIISTEKAFLLMRQFGFNIDGKMEEVIEGDIKSFGKHVVTFVAAPMVHWPEAMVTFDTTNGVLFSADAFGSFGALDGKLFNDEVDFKGEWIDDARRYYTNIVGKYGPHVQALLKKTGGIDIKMICPLHGPVWRTDLGYFIDKYDKWSRYEPEEKAVMIVYASMYGNTESAASALATKFVEKGMKNVVMYDVSNTHVSKLISETFRVSHVVLASVTYNLGIYPLMHNYLMDMKALNLQKRTFAILENGSWACKSGSLMREFLEDMREMTILEDKVTLMSSMNEDNVPDMDTLVESVLESMK